MSPSWVVRIIRCYMPITAQNKYRHNSWLNDWLISSNLRWRIYEWYIQSTARACRSVPERCQCERAFRETVFPEQISLMYLHRTRLEPWEQELPTLKWNFFGLLRHMKIKLRWLIQTYPKFEKKQKAIYKILKKVSPYVLRILSTMLYQQC